MRNGISIALAARHAYEAQRSVREPGEHAGRHRPGQLTGTSIGANGQISATYSNGSSVVVAQLALASVLNPGSMQNLGNNTFTATSATATPIIGTSATGSRGQITGGALESSTVDIATQFTNLLTYERGYQANSKVITTEDEHHAVDGRPIRASYSVRL